MHLLHVEQLELFEFTGDNIPDYAILSHTWEDDEVLFRHFQEGSAMQWKGWQKIDNCRKQARADGWKYVWIDTCCIDKSSSAELSEAINSMYQWYAGSAICYAYMADYDAQRGASDLSSCRWFKRGWTLQELLAPTQVFFYDKFWRVLGSKVSLSDLILRATRITEQDLANPKRASVARKMSWASSRTTTRKEDMAYCLLGLFDVNMPLLYGEGEKAFQRLQHEIIATSDDDSVFAWGEVVDMGNEGMLASSPGDCFLRGL